MKRLVSVMLCLILAAYGFPGVAAAEEGENLLAGKVIWSTAAAAAAGDLPKLTDGDAATVLVTPNAAQSALLRYFFDLGDNAPRYNKLRLRFDAYNAMSIKVYTSAQVYTAVNAVTSPPAATGTSSVKFLNATYSAPAATVNFIPEYITMPGGEAYPAAQLLSFDAKSDRYLCVEIKTAYSSLAGEYADVNNAIAEVILGYGVPASVEVTAAAEEVSVPSALAGDKTLALSARVLDAEGDEIAEAAFSGKTYGLAEEYQGGSIDPRTGVLTVGKTASAGNVTVIASCDAEGYTEIYGSKTIAILPIDNAEQTLAEAANALTFDALSPQRITSVGRNLTLPEAGAEGLTLGGRTYAGVSVTWHSGNTAVISHSGAVTRPAAGNTEVPFTATLAKDNAEGQTLTHEKTFVITVVQAGAPADMVNLMKGSYGWTTSGWGAPSLAVDGAIGYGGTASAWMLGRHSIGTINAGFVTKSRQVEKYNKVVLYLRTRHEPSSKMAAVAVTGYETMPNDPGPAGDKTVNFAAGSGMTQILSYGISPTDPDDLVLSVTLPETKHSAYFGIAVTNGAPANQNNCGVYELEVYYAAPYSVALTDPEASLYAHESGEPTQFDLPDLTVYDELGDVLTVPFEHSVTLARAHGGVTLQDGKINIAAGTAERSVDLLYTSWDEDRTWVEETVSIPLSVYTQDYYDAVAAGEYTDGVIPEKLEEN
ncbi:MAG: hypothetical protein LBH54_06575, partial [Clostridiales bacterium]|nr:hypothetical protein [Clostridiales bacterium]